MKKSIEIPPQDSCVEINRDPLCQVCYSSAFTCTKCKSHFVIRTTGAPDICIDCQLKALGEKKLRLFNWVIQKNRSSIIVSKIAGNRLRG